MISPNPTGIKASFMTVTSMARVMKGFKTEIPTQAHFSKTNLMDKGSINGKITPFTQALSIPVKNMAKDSFS